jgi:hypothetical protein
MDRDRAEILSDLKTELKQLQDTFRYQNLTSKQISIGENYEKLLIDGIKHFSKPESKSRITSFFIESDDNIMSKIKKAQSELLRLMSAQLMKKKKKKKKTKKKNKKKTKKRKNKTKRIIRK